MQGENIVPIPRELAGSRIHEFTAVAPEVRLIEISGLVRNVGPGSCRLLAMRRQRCIKPGRPRIELWRKPYLGGETALKMARAQAGFLDQRVDPRAAMRRQ